MHSKSTKPIIEVENISKLYHLGAIGATTFYESLDRLWRRKKTVPATDKKKSAISPDDPQAGPEPNSIWALKDVSFSVQQGDIVGIIGRNGAGKSTLLKLLSRITEPTSGQAILRGRTSSLLEVGTGFHPELTGRENVFLNGAILGMRRSEIKRKFDEIVAFAELEKFIDTPVKRYSSGMYVRLAFAVAAHLEPEILLVDEVLAVGDVQFQKKCLGKMGEVAKGGRTILFVSHNMTSISMLCNKGIFLKHGRVIPARDLDECIKLYIDDPDLKRACSWTGAEGNDAVMLNSFSIYQDGDKHESTFVTHKDTKITLSYELAHHIEGLIVGIAISSGKGTNLAYTRVDDFIADESYARAGSHEKTLVIPANTFADGVFSFTVDMGIHNIARIVDKSFLVDFVNVQGVGRKYLTGNIYSGIFRPLWTWV